MDFLNKSLAQLSDLFRSMTPGAADRGLLLAVVVVSMGYLFRESTSGPDAFLFGGEPLSDGSSRASKRRLRKRACRAISAKAIAFACRQGNRRRTWRRWPIATPCRRTSTRFLKMHSARAARGNRASKHASD